MVHARLICLSLIPITNDSQEGDTNCYIFIHFSMKTYVVGTPWNCLNETLPMGITATVFMQKQGKYCHFWSINKNVCDTDCCNDSSLIIWAMTRENLTLHASNNIGADQPAHADWSAPLFFQHGKYNSPTGSMQIFCFSGLTLAQNLL